MGGSRRVAQLVVAGLTALAAIGCAGPESDVVPRETVGPDRMEQLQDEDGLPMYFAGPSLAGLPLTEAKGWQPEAGGAFFAYGTCELPNGEGGCAPPVEIKHFRFRPRQWDLAAGCTGLPRLRGVPAARHDGLVLFTGSIVVKVYARSAREERRVAEELRGVNTPLEPSEPLPRPTRSVQRVVSRAC